MRGRAPVALYLLPLVAVVVGVDILFFEHDFWGRLVTNVGIVLVWGALYLSFLKRRRTQPPPDASNEPR